MFSKLMLRQLAFRIAVMKACGGAVMDWDYKSSKACKSHNFFFWTWLLHTWGGYVYSILMLTQQLMVIYGDPEEPQSVATTIIGFGESLTTLCICFLSTVITKNRSLVINLMNEILKYDKTMMEQLKADGRKLSRKHKKELHTQEILIFLVTLFTMVLPAMIIVIFAHPMEPTRRMIKDWFEIEINLTVKCIPVLLMFYVLLIAAGNGGVVLCLLVAMYYSVSTIALEDIQPEELDKEEHFFKRRNTFQTATLGEMKDEEIVVMYRNLQLFNTYLNQILANLMISFHNVACIGAAVSMAYFVIAHNDILQEAGPAGWFVVFGAMLAPVFLQFTEALMFGILCDISEDFIENGKSLVWRKSMYGKFLCTCRTFYVEEAYPFYHIHKETFLQFCEQWLGYTADLLLT